jgi:hypothetical protein
MMSLYLAKRDTDWAGYGVVLVVLNCLLSKVRE